MNKGGTHSVRGVRISMTDARHSSSVWPDDSPAGFYVGEPVGFVFHLESATIYFAGDTDVFGDMALIRRLHQPDIAVLPVGDRATIGAHGAALALELLEPRVCIPCHRSSTRRSSRFAFVSEASSPKKRPGLPGLS